MEWSGAGVFNGDDEDVLQVELILWRLIDTRLSHVWLVAHDTKIIRYSA